MRLIQEQEEMPHSTILLKKETRELLKTMGIKGESYDVIIIRLIDHYKTCPIVKRKGKE